MHIGYLMTICPAMSGSVTSSSRNWHRGGKTPLQSMKDWHKLKP